MSSKISKTEEDEAINRRLDERQFVFDPEEWDVFKAMLDQTQQQNPGLQALMQRKPIWEK